MTDKDTVPKLFLKQCNKWGNRMVAMRQCLNDFTTGVVDFESQFAWSSNGIQYGGVRIERIGIILMECKIFRQNGRFGGRN